MTRLERACWKVTLELLVQIALLAIRIGRRNNVIYDMSDELLHARRLVRELTGDDYKDLRRRQWKFREDSSEWRGPTEKSEHNDREQDTQCQ